MGDEFNLRLSEGYLPSHLTKIYLSCHLKEDPMPILDKFLHLKNVALFPHSFRGRRMVCSRNGFPQLQKLNFLGLKEWEEWIVEKGSMPLLQYLDISYCEKLKEIPNALRFITSLKDPVIRLSEIDFPSHLTTIHLTDCCLEENPIPVLEKLLHLKDMLLGKGSFCEKRMVFSRGGFPQLQTLGFYELEEWEEWMVEEGSMPLLNSLRIESCPKLNELPDGLRFITSLKRLTCRGMAKEWEKRLSKGGEDYYKVQHIHSVTVR